LLSDVEALRGIIDAVPHPIFVKDAESRFLVMNDAMCALMGHGFGELVGKSDRDFFPKEQAEVFYDTDRHVMATGKTNENEEYFTGNDGVVRTILTRKKRLALSSGTSLLVGCITDITDFRTAEEAIRHHAEHDYLTGVGNRSLFKKRLDRAVSETAAERCSAALLLVDLDGFKGVNDALGHSAGDNVLVQAANSLREIAGDESDVARLGGDEFAIIVRDAAQPDAATTLARSTCERLARPTFIGRRRVAVSASVGVAFARDAGCDPDKLIQQADVALYAAKKAGRNRWRVFEQAADAHRPYRGWAPPARRRD
jgi:diguanylate cyclase (GGDEF)-like protein/PAS domain S-box-containing protein